MTDEVLKTSLLFVALFLGAAGFFVSFCVLAMVVGIKNSTHQVVWKPLEEPKTEEDDDPFIYDPPLDPVEENPNKKIKRTKEEENEEFADLSDPSITSNDW